MSGLLALHRKTGYRYWGEGAEARKAREDRLRALTREPVREFEALPSMAPNPMPAFSLYAPPNLDASRRRANAALEKAGLRLRLR